MSNKIRKQIYIAPHQEERLKQLAAVTGLSEAEIIRQAIDQHMTTFQLTTRNLAAWEAERKFLDEWIARGPVPGGRKWTRDELHER